MPVETPDIAAIGTAAAFGAASGGLVVLSKPMTRKEMLLNMFGGIIFAASIPQVVEHYFGVHPVARCLLGVACGLSVPLIISTIQRINEKLAKQTEANADKKIGGQ
jgi:predicted MFS family arabinose efflux permease